MDRKESSRKCYLNRSPEIKRRAINSSKRSYWENRDKYIAQNRKARSERKIEVLTHYGDGRLVCVKCGFIDIRALCLDHINDDGYIERGNLNRSIVSGDRMYSKLKKRGYPDGYQTLCYNCNIIKRFEYLEKTKEQTTMGIEAIKCEIAKYPRISDEERNRRISEAAKRNWANPKIRERYITGLGNAFANKGGNE